MTNTSKTLVGEVRELTLRGMLLGAFITVLFTASNVYLGLKVGLTFASSIPAAVISMAVLKFFKGSNILENNMVQTQASSAGCLSSIIFVLPGMLMLGYWSGFPFIQTVIVCMAGGILGVMFTIPLRHIMIVESTLPYPEGVAAAEILKVGQEHSDKKDDNDSDSPKEGMQLLLSGALTSGLFALFTNGFRLVGDSISFCFKAGSSIFLIPCGFSFALLGAGYLVGIIGGTAMIAGAVFSWLGAVPVLSLIYPDATGSDFADYAMTLWATKVRFIGAGTIAVSAVWTVIILFKPLMQGISSSINVFKKSNTEPTQRIFQDLSPKAILFYIVISVLMIIGVFYNFISSAALSPALCWTLVFVVTLLAFLIGFLVASACAYMAGLIGTSSSPISGICIVSMLIVATVLLFIGKATGIFDIESGSKFLTALALFTISVVLAIATISNDNMQDLKTGFLVKATPWRQQIALVLGVIAGSLVIAPVLELLYEAYGFTGAVPRADMDPSLILSAPQATLMSTIASGIFNENLEWTYILIGFVVGAICIIADVVLRKTTNGKKSFPPLAVGIGIYLPATISTALFLGALISWISSSKIKKIFKGDKSQTPLKHAEHNGTLFSAGLIVGESIIGVILAFVIVASVSAGGSSSPLTIAIDNFDYVAKLLGLAAFVICMLYFYKKVIKATKAK